MRKDKLNLHDFSVILDRASTCRGSRETRGKLERALLPPPEIHEFASKLEDDESIKSILFEYTIAIIQKYLQS